MYEIRTLLRPTRAVLSVLLTSFLLCGASSPDGCNTSSQSNNIGPSKGEVTAAVVGTIAVVAVGTVVLVELHKSHHTVKGCVFAGPDGIEVITDQDKPRTYKLEGDISSVRAGILVRFQGDKVKKAKDSTGDQVFRVQKIKKDYGPCKIAAKSPA